MLYKYELGSRQGAHRRDNACRGLVKVGTISTSVGYTLCFRICVSGEMGNEGACW